MSRWCRVGAVAACVLLAGCGGVGTPVPGPTMTTTVAQAPAPAVVTVTASSAPPSRLPDVDPAAIRSAPAACGVPEHRLDSYRGEVGPVETLLQVEESLSGLPPVPPVALDVTKDGGADLVGVLSCTSGETPLSDHLVLYTGPATPVASFDVSRRSGHKLAVVRSIDVTGREIVVQWAGFDPGSATVDQYRGIVTWDGKALGMRGRTRLSGPRRVSVQQGAFLTPDGNVACQMYPQATWCDVDSITWTPAAAPSPTAPATPTGTAGTAAPTGCGDRPYGKTMVLAAGTARVSCTGQQGPEAASLGTPLTEWFRMGWDPVVLVDGRRSAALAAGSSMVVGSVRCEVATASVTCLDTKTGADFTLGRTVHRVGRG